MQHESQNSINRLGRLVFLSIAVLFFIFAYESILAWAFEPWKKVLVWGLFFLLILDIVHALSFAINRLIFRIQNSLKVLLLRPKNDIENDTYSSSDRPITSLTNDLLGYSKYAFVLAKKIAYSDTPATIGLHGEWGSGKTSLANLVTQFLTPRNTRIWAQNESLNQLKRDLQRSGQNLDEVLPNELLEKIELININAWQYASSQALWRALILRLSQRVEQKGLDLDTNKWHQRLYYSVTQEHKGEIQLNATSLNIALSQALLTFIGSLLFPSTWLLLIANGIGIRNLGESATSFSDLFEHKKYQLMRKQMESIEEFQEALEELVNVLLERKKDGLKQNRKLIIFIDDLDRCLPSVALEIMETIKTFLDVPGCVYVLLCDQKLLGQGVRTKFKELFGDQNDVYQKRGQEYIEKIIQISFQIPPVSYDNLKAYAIHNLGDIYLYQEIPYLDIVYKVTGNNPRKIKRLCHGLETAFEMMELNINQEPKESGVPKNNLEALKGTDQQSHRTSGESVKGVDDRKREFAKVYCLQYGWPETFLVLEEFLQIPQGDKSVLNRPTPPDELSREAFTKIDEILYNTDLKRFGRFLITVDWEKARSIGLNAVREFNLDLLRFLKTEPNFSDMSNGDLRNYIEWSAVFLNRISGTLTTTLANTPIEALDLSVRVYESLKRTGITTVGDVLDLLEKGETAVMSIRNFGEKSLDDLRNKMREKGYMRDEINNGEQQK
jgi:hypothetical protein